MGGWAIRRKWPMWCCFCVRRLRGGLPGKRLISAGDLWFRVGLRVRCLTVDFFEDLTRSFAPAWTGGVPVALCTPTGTAEAALATRVGEFSSVLLPSLL